jgi:hypothetical protein
VSQSHPASSYAHMIGGGSSRCNTVRLLWSPDGGDGSTQVEAQPGPWPPKKVLYTTTSPACTYWPGAHEDLASRSVRPDLLDTGLAEGLCLPRWGACRPRVVRSASRPPGGLTGQPRGLPGPAGPHGHAHVRGRLPREGALALPREGSAPGPARPLAQGTSAWGGTARAANARCPGRDPLGHGGPMCMVAPCAGWAPGQGWTVDQGWRWSPGQGERACAVPHADLPMGPGAGVQVYTSPVACSGIQRRNARILLESGKLEESSPFLRIAKKRENFAGIRGKGSGG